MENIYVFNEFLHERKQESVKEHITARIQGKRRNYGHIYTCINMRFRWLDNDQIMLEYINRRNVNKSLKANLVVVLDRFWPNEFSLSAFSYT